MEINSPEYSFGEEVAVRREKGGSSRLSFAKSYETFVRWLLERSGPGTLGHLASGLADAALIDTRVLLAARLGRDERHWPSPEDRFASDLLLPERISDPWLQALTRAAIAAPIPILLGGHTLVGPGIPLAFGGWSGRAPRASSRPTDGADG